MKKILILLLLILLCGCTSSYNLEISNDSFKESINMYIDKSIIPTTTQDGIELDDQVTPFLKNKYSAFFSNESAFYNKKVNELDDAYEVNMDYKYDEKNFKDANSLNSCFSNFIYESNKNYYIHAYGEFLCLYSDEFKISIKTKNKVIRHNADSVNGNVYTWNINQDNVLNTDIEFRVEKGMSKATFIYYVAGTIFLGALIISSIWILYKKRKENKI